MTLSEKIFLNQSVEEIYQKYYRRVYNYIYWRLHHHEAAEDLTADVFVTVLEKFYQFRGSDDDGLSSWIFSIVRNRTTDYLRQARLIREESVRNVPEVSHELIGWTKADDSLREPENPTIEYIMQRLSKEERDLLELRYSLELTNEEVAGLMNLTANAISHRYTRLLEKCQRIAKKNLDERHFF